MSSAYPYREITEKSQEKNGTFLVKSSFGGLFKDNVVRNNTIYI